MFNKIYLFIFLVFSTQASALNVEYFKFSNNSTYSQTENALLDEGLVGKDSRFILTTSLDYVKTPLSLMDGDQRVDDVVKNLWAWQIGGGIFLSPKAFLGFRTFMAQIDTGKEGIYGGDSVLEFNYKIKQTNSSALSIQPKVNLPTGANEFTTNNRKVGGYLGLNYEKKWNRFQGVVNLGYSHQPGAELSLGTDFTEIDYRQSLFTAIGLVMRMSEKWAVNFEGFRHNQLKGNQHPNEIYAGVRHQHSSRLASFAGLSLGASMRQSSNDYRFSAGLKYSPKDETIEPAPAPLPVAAKEPTKREKILTKEKMLYGQIVEMKEVFFANNSKALSSESTRVLKLVASKLKEISGKKTIVLEGHASTRGNNPAYNMELSRKRAVEVKTFLVAEGISESELQVVAYGDGKADDQIDEALNRKVMVRLYQKP